MCDSSSTPRSLLCGGFNSWGTLPGRRLGEEGAGELRHGGHDLRVIHILQHCHGATALDVVHDGLELRIVTDLWHVLQLLKLLPLNVSEGSIDHLGDAAIRGLLRSQIGEHLGEIWHAALQVLPQIAGDVVDHFRKLRLLHDLLGHLHELRVVQDGAHVGEIEAAWAATGDLGLLQLLLCSLQICTEPLVGGVQLHSLCILLHSQLVASLIEQRRAQAGVGLAVIGVQLQRLLAVSHGALVRLQVCMCSCAVGKVDGVGGVQLDGLRVVIHGLLILPTDHLLIAMRLELVSTQALKRIIAGIELCLGLLVSLEVRW
mmetsp:Transcript_11505/g.21111  ORF Transcript_11505/g.21111 Transcript_11505/m.21111 type:complete len:316 (-) Transcript_11505:338-1285(-)